MLAESHPNHADRDTQTVNVMHYTNEASLNTYLNLHICRHCNGHNTYHVYTIDTIATVTVVYNWQLTLGSTTINTYSNTTYKRRLCDQANWHQFHTTTPRDHVTSHG